MELVREEFAMESLNNYVILDSDSETAQSWRKSIGKLCEYENLQIDELSKDRVSQTEGEFYLVVSGGDGSLNYAARFIKDHHLEKRAVLVYHPNGTGNDFSRSVGLHGANMMEACSLITKGKKTHLDLAKLDDSYFANMGTFGIFAEVTPEVGGESKAVLGGFSYYIEGLKKVLNLEDFSCSFMIDGEKKIFTNVLGFFVGNSKFCGAGVQVTPDAKIDDGYLDLLIVNNAPKAELFQLAVELQRESANLAGYNVFSQKAKKIEFEASRPLAITLDGESQKADKGLLTILSRDLSIIVPKDL